jgi:ABC-type lipoprotein export system ATPase subunit
VTGPGHPTPAGPAEGPEIIDLPASRPTAAVPARPAPSRLGSRSRFGDDALIACDNLVRIYKIADLEVVALQGLDLLVEAGEMVAIVGASGSGKSTLLNILGGLDAPTAGHAVVAGYNLSRLSGRARTRYRRRVVGFVWQQTARNLLPFLTVAENVALPMTLDGRRDRAARVSSLLEQVGVAGRADDRPDRLSGGEQQRVAIAVALANEPAVLLADEPTGELDTATAEEIFGVLRRVNAEAGTTIVIVTHDPQVSEEVSRTVLIRDGRTSTETLRRTERVAEGEHRVIAEEFAVLDRAGRLQLPKTHVEALHLERRVRLRLEPDHVGVWPDRHDGHEPADDGPGGGRHEERGGTADGGADR